MDADWKARWIAALRSGEYEQGKEWLRFYDETTETEMFCCLGVLERLGEKQGIYDLANSNEYLLEDKAVEIFGLEFDQQKTLAEMNDSPKSFAEIADYIEANL